MTKSTPAFTAVLFALLPACYEPTAPEAPRQLPSLEAVPFELLAGARILFTRRTGQETGPYFVDGGGQTATSGWTGLWGWATLSPDGTRMAFRSPPSGSTVPYNWDIMISRVVSADGAFAVAAVLDYVGPPAWTSAGNLVYLLHEPGSTGSRPVIMSQAPVQGQGARPTVLHRFSALDEVDLLSVSDDGLSVSRTGDIAFAGEVSISGGNAYRAAAGIGLLDHDSAHTRAVFSLPAEPGIHPVVQAPSFSPAGDRVFFIVSFRPEPDTLRTQLWTVSVDGTGARLLATMPTGSWQSDAAEYSSCWVSASRVAFTVADGPRTSHVYVIDTTEGIPKPLTTQPGVSDAGISCAPR